MENKELSQVEDKIKAVSERIAKAEKKDIDQVLVKALREELEHLRNLRTEQESKNQ